MKKVIKALNRTVPIAWLILTSGGMLLPLENPAQGCPHAPQPDAGLRAAIDSQAESFPMGTKSGDFEDWFPGIYPDYAWKRTIREMGAGGLFRFDYAVFGSGTHGPSLVDSLSLLRYLPTPPQSTNTGQENDRAGSPSSVLRTAHQALDRPVTRAEKAARLIEDALVAARFYMANAMWYFWVGDSQNLSFVSRLPSHFPGIGRFDPGMLRRVTFYLESTAHGSFDLVMSHAPILWDMENTSLEPFQIRIVRNVRSFRWNYWDAETSSWRENWEDPHSMPKLVYFIITLNESPDEVAARVVAVAATAVQADLQGAGTPLPPRPLTNVLVLHTFGGLQADAQDSIQEIHTAAGQTKFAMEEPTAILSAGDLGFERPLASPKPSPILPRHGNRRPRNDVELAWMGRSGMELAKYLLALDIMDSTRPYDALNECWAGGTGGYLAALTDALDSVNPAPGPPCQPMKNIPLGRGRISLTVTDQDRKFNINVANEFILHNALRRLNIDAALIPTIVDSILDWRDADTTRRPHGNDGDDYLETPNEGYPPYATKNGPIDVLTELLLIRGLSPATLWGSSRDGGRTILPRMARPGNTRRNQPPAETFSLADCFTPLSGRLVNLNTASTLTLQLLPQIDENIAQAIVQARAGPDGVEGNEDDVPFRSVMELGLRVPGFNPAFVQQLVSVFSTRSLVFQVEVHVRIENDQRTYVGLLRRNNPRDIQLMTFHER